MCHRDVLGWLLVVVSLGEDEANVRGGAAGNLKPWIMGRPLRATVGGLAYHVSNRANALMQIFETAEEYDTFEQVIFEAQERFHMRVLAYCVMPDHWHLVLWPRRDGDLSRFTGWVTLTHTQRWHAQRGTTGTGHVYQGRYRSFPVEQDDHLLTVCRYVESNPARSELTEKPETWRYSSLWLRRNGTAEQKSLLDDGPVERPRQWLRQVHRPFTETQLNDLRLCVRRGRPYGSTEWVRRTARRLGLESTLRPRGRPRKDAQREVPIAAS